MRGATWEEIDEQAGVWTIPGTRMKGGDDHTVTLSPRALAIVGEMRATGSDYVFPSPTDPRKPLSSMGMLTLLDRMRYRSRTTVHGVCRASFSTWANDNGVARPALGNRPLAQDVLGNLHLGSSILSFRHDLSCNSKGSFLS